MKKGIYILFLFSSFLIHSQKKVLKRFQSEAEIVNVHSTGLDNVEIQNSSNNFIEVILTAESYDDQLILLEDNKDETTIKFYFEGTETREVIFRKFITKRLQRASAIIKIPPGKVVNIFGENVDVNSKDLLSKLSIYIDNGIVKLNTIQKDTSVKLYIGNVYANTQKSNLNIISNTGKIQVNKAYYVRGFTRKTSNKNPTFTVNSIKANVFLKADF